MCLFFKLQNAANIVFLNFTTVNFFIRTATSEYGSAMLRPNV